MPCCGPPSATPSRRPSSSSPRPSGSASSSWASSCRPSGTSPNGSGSSRNTLREAIAALRDSGLVTTRRGRGGGTVVTYAGRGQGADATVLDGPPVRRGAALEDALDFRRVVEPGAARLAATRPLSRDQRDWLTESCRAVSRGRRRPAPDRRLAAAPRDRHARRLADARRRGDAGPGGARTSMLSPIPVLRINIEHSNEQHDQSSAADPRR